jgi:hypothetical protein
MDHRWSRRWDRHVLPARVFSARINNQAPFFGGFAVSPVAGRIPEPKAGLSISHLVTDSCAGRASIVDRALVIERAIVCAHVDPVDAAVKLFRSGPRII